MTAPAVEPLTRDMAHGIPPVRGMRPHLRDGRRRRLPRYCSAPSAPIQALPLFRQLLSFLSVGALATALQYALTLLMVVVGGVALVPASTAAFLVSAAFNYWANARLTFSRQGRPAGDRSQQLRFVVMVALGCALNAALLRLALGAGVHGVASQLLATAGVLASNFAISRLWVFRRR